MAADGHSLTGSTDDHVEQSFEMGQMTAEVGKDGPASLKSLRLI
jgi:hypothetical protein